MQNKNLLSKLVSLFVKKGYKIRSFNLIIKVVSLLKFCCLNSFRNNFYKLYFMVSKLKIPVQLRNEKVGTLFYQLPYPTKLNRQYNLGFLLLGKALRMRKERGLFRKLFFEILSLISSRSYSRLLKKRILLKAKNNVIWLKQKHARHLVLQKMSKKKVPSIKPESKTVVANIMNSHISDHFEPRNMELMRIRRESRKKLINDISLQNFDSLDLDLLY